MFVVGAFALTVWLFGPRAVAVLEARMRTDQATSPPVTLDRVGYVNCPAWLDRPLLLAVSAALSPWLADEVPILDEDLARRLRDGIATVPWVAAARLERVFPDRFRIELDLRQPVLAVRSADGEPLCLLDREGTMLPWVDTPLPATYLYREGGGRPSMTVVAGQIAPDPRACAAAAIAVEWRDELAPLVANCPPLLEVDATNFDERWARGPSYPEIRVKLGRHDGQPVVFFYGRPVGSRRDRVPVRTKATVLGRILALHPGLDGLVAGDLRLQNRWQEYLQPRESGTSDPLGPWADLPQPR